MKKQEAGGASLNFLQLYLPTLLRTTRAAVREQRRRRPAARSELLQCIESTAAVLLYPRVPAVRAHRRLHRCNAACALDGRFVLDVCDGDLTAAY